MLGVGTRSVQGFPLVYVILFADLKNLFKVLDIYCIGPTFLFNFLDGARLLHGVVGFPEAGGARPLDGAQLLPVVMDGSVHPVSGARAYA